MRRIDELFMAWPFLGSRRMAQMLASGWAAAEPRAHAAADAPHRHRRAWAEAADDQAGAGPQELRRICCATLRSTGRTRCGRRTSPTCRSGGASSTSPRRWTGRAARCLRGGLATRWTHRSASVRSRRRSSAAASPTSSTPIRAAPVHQRRFHRHARQRRGAHRDGRARPVARQRVHRAAVAQPQIRGHLSQGRCRWTRGARWNRRLVRVRQRAAPAPSPRQPDANAGLARGHDRGARPNGCGHDACPADKRGQRWRVAHMPIAATAPRSSNRLSMILRV